jgi:putative transposase
MPRKARDVSSGSLHHVTQRGNDQQLTFAGDGQRLGYLELLRETCRDEGVEMFGYCLMPNHVHLILRPKEDEGISRVMHKVSGEHAKRFNREAGRTGHVWQNRFFSAILDRIHVWTALRYVDLNPVRAAMVEAAADWRWSSAKAHLDRKPDELGLLALAEMFTWRDYPDWHRFLEDPDPVADELLRMATRKGGRLGP